MDEDPKPPPSAEDKKWEVIGSDPDEPLHLPPLVERLFNWLMLGLLGAVVFSVCGGLLFLLSARRMGYNETPVTALSRFIGGGTMGLLWLYRALRKRGASWF